MSKKKLVAYSASPFLLGLVIGSFLPTPMDLVHFGLVLPWLQANLNNPAAGWQVAVVSFVDWYLLDSIFYIALFLAAVKIHPVRQRIVSILVVVFVVGLLINLAYTGRFLTPFPLGRP